VFVFTPNSKNIVYKKQNIFGKNDKSTSILWALFAPKSNHQNGQHSSWLDNSTLYMLTNQQVIYFLLQWIMNKCTNHSKLLGTFKV